MTSWTSCTVPIVPFALHICLLFATCRILGERDLADKYWDSAISGPIHSGSGPRTGERLHPPPAPCSPCPPPPHACVHKATRLSTTRYTHVVVCTPYISLITHQASRITPQALPLTIPSLSLVRLTFAQWGKSARTAHAAPIQSYSTRRQSRSQRSALNMAWRV